MKKFVSIGLSSLIALSLLVGCASKSPNNDSFKYVGLKVYDPVYIAEDLGYFDDESLDVEIIDTVAGGATGVQMVSSGEAQGALVSTMALINGRASGLPVVGVADIQSSFEGYPLEEFYVRADSGIDSVEDLKGKKIAINLQKSSFHYTWIQVLREAGLSPDDVTFVNLSFDMQVESLKRGQVDAIGLMQPYSKTAREDADLKMLYDATDAFGERQFCEIFVNSVWAENNPDSAKKFVSAIAKAEAWVVDNQDEAKNIISKYTGVDPEYIDDYKFQENAMVVEEDAEYWLEFMREIEGTPDWVKASDVVTNEYNEKL